MKNICFGVGVFNLLEIQCSNYYQNIFETLMILLLPKFLFTLYCYSLGTTNFFMMLPMNPFLIYIQ